MPLIWTTEQVLGLAPDANILRSSRVLAVPEKWDALNHSNHILSGSYRVPNRDPFNIAVDLDTLRFTCSCKNRKFPCNHCIALLLLAVDQPMAFASDNVPEFAKRKPAAAESDTVVTSGDGSAEKRQRQRHRSLERGLIELQRWLVDTMRTGMAVLPSHKAEAWDALARQMVDSHAPALAYQIRGWADIIETEKEWADLLLREFGRIQLLISTFSRFDSLTPPTQADLYRAVGWLSKNNPQDELLEDGWLVLGQQQRLTGKRTVRKLYLQGTQSKRVAILTDVVSKNRQSNGAFATGTVINATLRIFSSKTPIHARFEERTSVTQPETRPESISIEQVISTYSQHLSRNPWPGSWPYAVLADYVLELNQGWFLQDSAGNLLPVEGTQFGWHLKALEGNIVCGLWDGQSFTPLSVWTQDRMLPLQILGAGK